MNKKEFIKILKNAPDNMQYVFQFRVDHKDKGWQDVWEEMSKELYITNGEDDQTFEVWELYMEMGELKTFSIDMDIENDLPDSTEFTIFPWRTTRTPKRFSSSDAAVTQILTNQLYMLEFIRDYYAREYGSIDTTINDLLNNEYADTLRIRDKLSEYTLACIRT